MKKKGVLVVVVAIVLVAALLLGSWGTGIGWRWFKAPLEGKVEMRETVQSGDFRMHSYEQFFTLNAAIQTAEVMLDSQIALLDVFNEGSDRWAKQQNIVAVQLICSD